NQGSYTVSGANTFNMNAGVTVRASGAEAGATPSAQAVVGPNTQLSIATLRVYELQMPDTMGVFVAESLRDARVALRAALYDAALELLEGCEDWPAAFAEQSVTIKAETIGRRDPVGAVTYLT